MDRIVQLDRLILQKATVDECRENSRRNVHGMRTSAKHLRRIEGFWRLFSDLDHQKLVFDSRTSN